MRLCGFLIAVSLASAAPSSLSRNLKDTKSDARRAKSRAAASSAAAAEPPAWLADGCSAQELAPGVAVEGSLTASDCKMRDVVSGSRSDAAVDLYDLKLERRSILVARQSSGEFDTTLYIHNNAGTRLATNNDADGGTNSRITISLPAGTYRILATSRDLATGSYRLEASPEAPRACDVRPITPGETTRSELTATGCRFLDFYDFIGDESPVNAFRFQAARQAVVTIDLQSDSFDAALELVDPIEDETIANNDNARGSTDAQILAGVPAGTYVILASAAKPGAGVFTIRLASEEPRPCTPAALDANSLARTELNEPDCRVLDYLPPSDDISYLDLYRLRVEKRTVLTVSQRSSAFDTLLALLTENQQLVTLNDDSTSGSTDSRMVAHLEPGAYLVLATSFEPASGAYELESATEDPRACAVEELTPSGAASGNLSLAGCRVLDYVPMNSTDEPTAIYRVAVDKKLIVTFEVSSTDFDAYVRVTDASHRLLFWNQNAESGRTDARVMTVLIPGVYYIFASSSNQRGGAFTLRTTAQEPKACPIQDIGLNATADGSLDAGDCRFSDFSPSSAMSPYIDQYRVTVAERGRLEVSAASSELPPFLLILDERDRILGSDLNPSAVNTARASATLPPGTYIVLVSALTTRTGRYTVTTAFTPQ
jgi:hypothetical protein